MDQTPDHIWLLIARKLSGEATAEELQELEELLRLHPDAGYSKEIFHDWWQNQPDHDRQYAENRYKELVLQMKTMGIDEGKFIEDDHFINNEAEETRNPGSKRRRWLMAFCSLILILTAGYYISRITGNGGQGAATQQLATNQVTTRNGSKTNLVLPDGTKVWLNSGSQLNYDKNYGNKLREVSLVGEAYFDVVKNPERPFVIHTKKMDIKVLGTAFNVKCYPGEKTTETSLIRGSIEVTLKDRQEKIMLKPNEKLVISNLDADSKEGTVAGKGKAEKETITNEKPIISLSHLTVLPENNTVVETAWVQNKLIFSGESFEDVALKMERWYNVKIDFADERLKEERLTGNFEKESLVQALDALRFATPFAYSVKDDEIIISKKAILKR